jgi:alkanesulfonate monooxygenase SsuD/methylene tetrahydromethanopterin reductase-like flavin-dependent oxidoreductase (luciferase family)
MDHEGDIISVTHQKDLDEARTVPSLRIVIARDVEEARQILSSGPAGIMNMSLNQSMSSGYYQGNGQLGGIGQQVHAELEQHLAAQTRTSNLNAQKF